VRKNKKKYFLSHFCGMFCWCICWCEKKNGSFLR